MSHRLNVITFSLIQRYDYDIRKWIHKMDIDHRTVMNMYSHIKTTVKSETYTHYDIEEVSD